MSAQPEYPVAASADTQREQTKGSSPVSSTDHATYLLPEDGTPITISTTKLLPIKDAGSADGKLASQTSLLIEYYEAGKTGDKLRTRPSVRVRVTPSNHRKPRMTSDAVQITGIGRDKKPSYTRRISLGNKTDRATIRAIDTTNMSKSSDSANSPGHPPVEVELLDPTSSDLSGSRHDLRSLHNASELSSIPPDSLLDFSTLAARQRGLAAADPNSAKTKIISTTLLAAPARPRSRSLSQERIAQKVIQKLNASSPRGLVHRSSAPRDHAYSGIEYEPGDKPSVRKERRRRSSRPSADSIERDLHSPDSSQLSSKFTNSQTSYRSTTSKVSLNNPKLLQVVEDTVRRIILPELHQLRRENRAEASDSRPSSATHNDNLENVSQDSEDRDTRKPKVVLNRSDNDPGQVLSRGDSERRQDRAPLAERANQASSRSTRSDLGSIGSEHAYTHRGVSAPAVAATAGLTAAAFNHNAFRRAAMSDGRITPGRVIEDSAAFHPRKLSNTHVPFTTVTNESETTRESIRSSSDEGLVSTDSRHSHRYHESRQSPGSEQEAAALPAYVPLPTNRVESRRASVVSRKSASGQSQLSLPHESSEITVTQQTISGRAENAALLATGIGHASILSHVPDAQRYAEPGAGHRATSPNESISSFHEKRNSLIPHALSIKSASTSEGRASKAASPTSVSSPRRSVPRLSRDLSSYDDSSFDEYANEACPDIVAATHGFDDVDSWFRAQHEQNEQHRASLIDSSLHDLASKFAGSDLRSAADSQRMTQPSPGTNPKFRQTPAGIESSVASLHESSVVSSATPSDLTSDPKTDKRSFPNDGTQPQRHSNDSTRHDHTETPPAVEITPQESHWSAIRAHAQKLSDKSPSERQNAAGSPPYSENVSRQSRRSIKDDIPVVMGANAIPSLTDPLPEIGHGLHDTGSDVDTNPPSIQGRRSDLKGKLHNVSSADGHVDISMETASPNLDSRRTTQASTAPSTSVDEMYHDDRSLTPTQTTLSSNLYRRDPTLGVTRAYPKRKTELNAKELAEFEAMMGGSDSLRGSKQDHYLSSDSHGMGSSLLYDHTAVKNADRIQSKDVVALLDHLTARDAERNARDTEMLVTLVRSATEMRTYFDELKNFIIEQDRMVMKRTDDDAGWVAKKVLDGTSAQPPTAPQVARNDVDNEFSAKRKNIFARALQGIGMKSNNERDRIEDMLLRLLDNVESLKETQGQGTGVPWDIPHQSKGSGVRGLPVAQSNIGMNSYEHRRAVEQYNPFDRSGSVTPTPITIPYMLQPTTRLDTQPVMKKSLDGLPTSSGYGGCTSTPDRKVPRKQVGDPDLARYRDREPKGELTLEELEKHKSQVSSTGPALSRWSKTTISSAAQEGYDSRRQSQEPNVVNKHYSDNSIQGEQEYYRDAETSILNDDERSMQSAADQSARNSPSAEHKTRSVRSANSRFNRTPSPLLPSETSSVRPQSAQSPAIKSIKSAISRASSATPSSVSQRSNMLDRDDTSMQDPKYKAHRHSLPLQHPQPRAGQTDRHQSTLESQAQTFSSYESSSDISSRSSHSSTSDAMIWGSTPAISLARANMVSEAANPSAYTASPRRPGSGKDQSPLVPRYTPDSFVQQAPQYHQQVQPVQTFQRNYYNSPLGAGHLLEPIEEVRYSLETERSIHSSPGPSSPGRSPRVGGPRPMGSRGSSMRG